VWLAPTNRLCSKRDFPPLSTVPISMSLPLTSSSIFIDGQLRPGVYKIQNIRSGTYLDIGANSRKVCCRPARDLAEGRGLWEIRSLGAGYTVRFVEPRRPEQFCAPTIKSEYSRLVIAAYPVAWRLEIIDGYVRFFWEATNFGWSLRHRSRRNGAEVWSAPSGGEGMSRRIWNLIPVRVEGVL